MATALTFRSAQADDWLQLWPLLQIFGAPASEAVAHERFLQIVVDRAHLLAVAVNAKEVIIGYVWAQNFGPHLRVGFSTARLHDLFVTEGVRAQGVGRLLLGHVSGWAKGTGVTYLQWQANKSSKAFYEACGMQSVTDPDPDHPFFELEFE